MSNPPRGSGGSAKANIESIYGLSPVQEGILYHTLEHADLDIYLQQFACTLDGLDQPQHWRDAWDYCVQRHPALRTLFTWDKRDHPLQLVRKRVELPWESLDWSELDEQECARRIELLREADCRRRFDLSSAPLLRFTLIRTGQSRYYFLWTFHHILLDGWSQRLLFSQAVARYRQGATRCAQEACGALPYEAFIAWLGKRDPAADTAFWTDRLADFRQPTLIAEAMPVGHPQDLAQDTGVELLSFDEQFTNKLQQASVRHRVTANTLLLAAWGLVLGVHCRRQDVLFGTTVAGRPADIRGAENIVGLCISTLPVRMQLPSSGDLSAWLRGIQSSQQAASSHENAALTTIQRCSGLASGSPLFDHILVFENLPSGSATQSVGDMPRVEAPQYYSYSHYPLAILVEPGARLDISAVFRGSRFSAEAAAALLRHLASVLDVLVNTDEPQAQDISLLTAQERRLMELAWNPAAPPQPPCFVMHHWIERTAQQFPDRVALVDEGSEYSFREMNAAANRLAWHLMDRGVSPGSHVVVLMERSAAAIVSFLAVLKAGGVYIPLDEETPKRRVSAILQELAVHAPKVLTEERMLESLPQLFEAPICIDRDAQLIETREAGDPNLPARPDQLAYIIYTSGSSGAPKGVMIEHRHLANSTQARLDYYPRQPGAFLLLSSLAVDSSVAGIYWSLCVGASLVIARRRLEQDPANVGELIQRHGVSHLLCIPSLYQLLLENIDSDRLRSLTTVIVAGEACPAGLVRSHRELLAPTGLYNEYGPSECTVWATVADLGDCEEGHSVPIGRPVRSASTYILDQRLRSVPPGVVGELYLGGVSVARGYLDDPELSARAFVTAHTVLQSEAASGGRLYRTGDLARFREDGNIEFLGRADNQLKVRGYRIEPEEIEQLLVRHPSVREAAVFLSSPRGGAEKSAAGYMAPPRLTACVTSSTETVPDPAELRDFVRANLPGHMVPQDVYAVADLPRNPGGKISRGSLSGFAWQKLSTEPRAAAVHAPAVVGEREEILLEIWREVLGVEKLQLDSNFFELGGDSLLSIRVLSRARKAGLNLSSDDFFAEPTIAGQARLARRGEESADVAEATSGNVVLSPAQAWFFEHGSSTRSQWNQSLLLEVGAPLQFGSLEPALRALFDSHEALRLVFIDREDGTIPLISEELAELPLARIALPGLAGEELAAAIENEASRLHRGFDLAVGPLVSCCYFDTDENQSDRLLICAHHLLVDAESWRILSAELSVRWRAVEEGSEPQVARSSSYRSWVGQLANYADSGQLAAERSYWHKVVTAPSAALPLDRRASSGGNRRATARVLSVSLGRADTEALLLELPQKYGSDLLEGLLACFGRGLLAWAGADQMRITLEGHGREALLAGADASHTVGWMTAIYPFLLSKTAAETAEQTLLQVKEALRAIPAGGVGYGILRYLARAAGGAGDLAANQVDGICFNYLGQVDKLRAESQLLRVERENVGECRAPDGERLFVLEVNCWVSKGRFVANFEYGTELHDRATIEALADGFLGELRELAAISVASVDSIRTPSDFPLAGIGQAELDRIGQLLNDADVDGS